VDHQDIRYFKKKVEDFDCRKVLISKERIEHKGIESWIPDDINSLVQSKI